MVILLPCCPRLHPRDETLCPLVCLGLTGSWLLFCDLPDPEVPVYVPSGPHQGPSQDLSQALPGPESWGGGSLNFVCPFPSCAPRPPEVATDTHC